MDHRGRWFHAASLNYHPDENGRWKGHWIGRVFGPGPGGMRWRNIRGVSFASRRLGRVWAVWIGANRPPVAARPVVPPHVRAAAETLVRQREAEHPGRYDMVDQGHIDVLIDYVRGLS